MNRFTLNKIEAGHYRTADGVYDIRDTYDPSGAPWVRNGRNSNRWIVKNLTDGETFRAYTLADIRWQLGLRKGKS